MPFVIYAAPNFTENAVRFIGTLANLEGVRLGLVSQEPKEWLPSEVQSKLADFHRVADVFDAAQLEAAARALSARQGTIHRFLAAVEQAQEPVAEVREALGIAGMGVEAAKNFRDKGRMKNLLRSAGLPCARHQKVVSNKAAFEFAQANGFPLVVKPPDGAASQATYRATNEAELAHALSMNPPAEGNEVLLEEFITGTEHSFDTFSIAGKPVFHSLTHYYPNPLEAMREPWIQWQVVLPREVESPAFDDIKAAAFKTLDVLGMGTGMSHLEWFRRSDGSLAISEVAARPPGAQITTLLSRANDFDCVAAWGRLMIFDEFPVPERKYAVGAAFLRGMGQGRVQQVRGLEHISAEVRHLICDAKIPKHGQEKSKSYEGEGYIIVRHRETAVVQQALSHIVSTVRVVLG
ncbi:MAG: ATP-grasp domain-containing protein [Saprospiraceae bacterium]|jgi:biotin carboxylase|nr:ATP-grasp domain-containing protein [Saprospiraceae bacterium]